MNRTGISLLLAASAISGSRAGRAGAANAPVADTAPVAAKRADAPIAAAPFEFADGDRVALVGNAFIEREQAYGDFEAVLTSRFPSRAISFRNLGWSGDTVWGESRAGFGSVKEGYAALLKAVAGVKPTVIFVAYGMNESFDGPAGLPKFQQGLDSLLDDLAKTGARLVLLSPIRHEDLGRPLPDPAAHNKDLALYVDAIARTARRRGCRFVNLFTVDSPAPTAGDAKADAAAATSAAPQILTDNGIHPTAFGYWRLALAAARSLGVPVRPWSVEIDGAAGKATGDGTKVQLGGVTPTAVRFTAIDAALPAPPPPAGPNAKAPPATSCLLRVRGLSPGRYALTIDGSSSAVASAEEWAGGVSLPPGPQAAQAEALRQKIIAKDRLFFYRWRPQNETYIYGFRKHEQGRNAAEIPLFDPLVADADTAIGKLKEPIPHVYDLAGAPDAGKS